MKVEKLAKSGQMVQNCYPLSPDKYRWLLEKGEKRLVQRSADLKQRVKRTHMDDLQDIADYKKTEIVLYNNVFHKIRRFEPSNQGL